MPKSEFEKQFPPYEMRRTISWTENNRRAYESIAVRQHQKVGFIAALSWVLKEISLDPDVDVVILIEQELKELKNG